MSGHYLASATAPVMLRNPVDRLFPQFASARSAGEAAGSFGEWVHAQVRGESVRRPRFGAVWTGMYATHLRRWLSHFPCEQLRLFFYSARPVRVLAELFEFIGVDLNQAVDLSRRHNVTIEPRWPQLQRLLRPAARRAGAVLPVEMHRALREWSRRPSTRRPTSEERAKVAAEYDADVEALQELLGRNLSHWRVPPAAARHRPG